MLQAMQIFGLLSFHGTEKISEGIASKLSGENFLNEEGMYSELHLERNWQYGSVMIAVTNSLRVC